MASSEGYKTPRGSVFEPTVAAASTAGIPPTITTPLAGLPAKALLTNGSDGSPHGLPSEASKVP